MNLNCEQNDYQILGRLKDKNIKEGVHVYVQAGLAKNIVPPTVTILTARSTSLATVHI